MWAVIPFGTALAISDLTLGIVYFLAISSLGVFGVLFAGWSANSKPLQELRVADRQSRNAGLRYERPK